MFNHVERPQRPPHARTPSSATLCSLRGDSRSLHPSNLNPLSIPQSFDDGSFEDIELAPPPSALTSKPTHYDPAVAGSLLDDDLSATARGHQRSLTDTFFDNCRPLVNRATSTLQQTPRPSFHSPTKSLASFIPSRSNTSEATTPAEQTKPRANKLFGNLFNDTSAPVQLGVAPPSPSKEDPEDSDNDDEERTMATHAFTRSPQTTRTAPTPRNLPVTSHSASAGRGGSKFSWLLNTNKPSAAPLTTARTNPSDELLNLDIPHALFPYGALDPLNPSSFHDLLSTAEALLSRYQASYRAMHTALADMRAEQSAQDDELDEAETRARHLKMQLDDMAARAAEQDEAMRALKEELALEKQKRKEEEEARKRSLALIKGPNCAHRECRIDHETMPRRQKRVSNDGSCVSDSGFESGDDASSIFSRANDPRSPISPVTSSAPSEAEAEEERISSLARPRPQHRRSTYEKVLGGMPLHQQQQQQQRRGSKLDQEVKQGWSFGCANCEGGAQSSVWGRLAKEREESRSLRRRVEELEGAVEGVLNLVDGPWGLGGK